MKHCYYTCDDSEGGAGDLQPAVEACDQLGSDIFAWVGFKVIERSFQDVFFFAAPA